MGADGVYSYQGATLKLTLVTWQGDKRVDHVLEVPVPPGTLLERQELAVIPGVALAQKKESVISSIPFSLSGTMYAAPCNSVDHYVLDDNEL